jgi:hypothetical protein
MRRQVKRKTLKHLTSTQKCGGCDGGFGKGPKPQGIETVTVTLREFNGK